MLKTRIITALALLAIFLPVLFFLPVEVLYVVLSIVIGLASWEWSRLLWLDINPIFHKLYAGLVVSILYSVWWLGASNLSPDYFFITQLSSIFFTFVFWVLIVPMLMRRGLNLSLNKMIILIRKLY